MSSRSLDDLRPEIRPMADAFKEACDQAGIDFIFTCTLRPSTPDQANLYAQGRTAPGHIVTDAPPGESAHNYGLAFDVAPIVNGKLDWNGEDPVWETMGEIGERLGLTWLGAPGSKFPEKPHFEHPQWKQLAGLS